MELIRERKNTFRTTFTQGTLVRVWNAITDLLFLHPVSNNRTQRVGSSAWFGLATWKVAKIRPKRHKASLAICLVFLFALAPPSDSLDKPMSSETGDKDQLPDRCYASNVLFYISALKEGRHCVNWILSVPIRWSKWGTCTVNENK